MARHFLALTLSVLALSGCSSMQDWANTHLPVIGGQPCEHWQCFTESGRGQSDLNKQERLQRETAATSSDAQGQQVPAENPAVPAAQAPTPAPVPAVAMPAAPKSPTPYDMTPDQLDQLSPPTAP